MADKEQEGTWLSPTSYQHLQDELDEMITVQRPIITKMIEEARSEGDLSENGGYQAAREEQAKLEGRILDLRHLLDTAHVSEPPSGKTVAAGTLVTATIAGEEETFLLGSREAADHVDVEVYPENAPLGQAIMGHKKGDKVTFKNRMGRPVHVEILNIQPYEG